MRFAHVLVLAVSLAQLSTIQAWGNNNLLQELQERAQEEHDGTITDKQARKEAKKAARKEAKKAARKEAKKAARKEAKLAKKEWKKQMKALKKRAESESNEQLKEDAAEVYRELKKRSASLMKDGVKLLLPKRIYPIIAWYNRNAEPDVCTEEELAEANKRFGLLINGVLKSRLFDPVNYVFTTSAEEPARDHNRNLRGEDDRELGYRIPSGATGYLGSWARGGRRRLDEDEDDEELAHITPADEERSVGSFGELDMYLSELKTVLEGQCKKLLESIAYSGGAQSWSCKDGIRAATCEVLLDSWEYVEIAEEDDE